MLTRKLTISIPPSKRQRFADTSHPKAMEEIKSIDRTDMVMGLSLDSVTTNFQNQVGIDEQVEDILKEDNKQKVAAGFPPPLPQEQCVLPHQRPAQSYQNSKQKQISKGNKDQEGRHPRYDPILVSYAHLLPILVEVGAIVLNKPNLLSFPTVISMTLMPRVDTMLNT